MHRLKKASMTNGSPPQISTVDLLLFHRQEREFFRHLIQDLHQRPLPTQWVMSLWLWLESIGHHDFIRHVSSSPDHVVLRFLSEADSCLRRLVRSSASAPPSPDSEADELPLTNTLVAEPIGLRFFDCHRDVALKGVSYFYKNVAEIIFDDNVMEAAARDANHPATRRVLSSGLHIWHPPLPHHSLDSRPPANSFHIIARNLNPMARPWSPATDQSPEDQRSMFITFSKGYPLTRDDIKDFFNMRFGRPCVETVMIERAPAGMAPMYGRVVFTSASMIVAVLNGQRTAKFMIKGRHLWARMYVPRHSPPH